MASYEADGMIIDQILFWYDQPVSYLGRVQNSDDRPCLVILVDNSGNQDIFHRLRFESEVGLRASLAHGISPTAQTYEMATDLARLSCVTGDEPWVETTIDKLITLDGDFFTTLSPSKSRGHVSTEKWGHDHHTLLSYLHDLYVQAGQKQATMEYQRMRINPHHHLVQAELCEWNTQDSSWNDNRGTRLLKYDLNPIDLSSMNPDQKAEYQIGYHDDIDCIEEFEAEGFIEIISSAKGHYIMTQAGIDYLHQYQKDAKKEVFCE